MMTIGSAAGTGSNMQPGSIGMGLQNDSVSKNIQQQIANAQKKQQELSSDKNLSLEEKMKKKQELQQEIANLNQQLRQHQAEQRRQQQAAQRRQQANQMSVNDLSGGTRRTGAAKAGSNTGLSQAGMQAMLSADTSMKQARVQGSTAKQMQNRAGVLRAEIKQDAGRGDTEKKEAELADLEQKSLAATASQMSSLANANQAAAEAADAQNDEKADKEQKNSRTEKDSHSRQKTDGTKNNKDTAGASFKDDEKAGKTEAAESVPSEETRETELSAAEKTAARMGSYASVDIRL